MNSIIQAQNLSKHYQQEGKNSITIIDNLNFKLQHGERVAIIGKSGTGKSTLLSVLSGLDTFYEGKIFFEGKNLKELNKSEKNQILNKKIGFLYQFHHLLPEFNAIENVAMPLLIAQENIKQSYQKAQELLEQVGLEDRVKHKPNQLSGGERQRVAIARSLINNPECIFMDEPTGNLDRGNSEKLMELILKINEQKNQSFIIVTHDYELVKNLKVYELKDKKLITH